MPLGAVGPLSTTLATGAKVPLRREWATTAEPCRGEREQVLVAFAVVVEGEQAIRQRVQLVAGDTVESW